MKLRLSRRALISGLASSLAAVPALAGNQSSNSSSNCSNGRCSRVDSLVIDDDRGRRGWYREERWREYPDRLRRLERTWGWDERPERHYRRPRREDDDD